MGKDYGWWVDLSKVALDEKAGTKTSWIHALPVGTYQHPLHGTLDLTPTKLAALAASVKTKVRGIDPDIDYDHKEDPAKGHQAAGWVKDTDVRQDGLWLNVDWTADAAKDIADKKYRYFSAEFTDTWVDPQGKEHTDVLVGGGLTNRPWMKNLFPVNLSEVSSFNTDPPGGGNDEVDGKKLRAALGLAETTTDDEVFTKLGEIGTGLKATTESVTKLTEDNKKLADEIAKLKEPDATDPELRKLIESSPAFAKLYEATLEKDKKLAEMAEGVKLAEVEKQLTELQAGRVFALAPTAREGLRNLMLRLPAEGNKALTEFLVSVTEGKALVDLSERGYTGRRDNPLAGGATTRFNEAIEGLLAANKEMNYGDAVERVARENPTLFAEYREDNYTFKA